MIEIYDVLRAILPPNERPTVVTRSRTDRLPCGRHLSVPFFGSHVSFSFMVSVSSSTSGTLSHPGTTHPGRGAVSGPEVKSKGATGSTAGAGASSGRLGWRGA